MKRTGEASNSCPQESIEDGRPVGMSRLTVRPRQEILLLLSERLL